MRNKYEDTYLKIFYGNMELRVLIPLVQYVGMFFGNVSSTLQMMLEAQSQKKSIINVIDILKWKEWGGKNNYNKIAIGRI